MISKLSSQMWKEEPASVKEEYKRKAKEEEAKHRALYPDYKYQPVR
jgi:HMG (high mobility group) box